jgi:hypothetical protein
MITKSPIALYHSIGEAIAVKKLVAEILSRNLTISVKELGAGWETTLEASRNPRAIMRELGKSVNGESLLTLETEQGETAGWFLLIFGNDPLEIVNNHAGADICDDICNAWQRAVLQ